MNFSIERRLGGGRLLLGLRGAIDEHADLSAVAGIDRDADIDLDGVRRINSFGVRAWTRALRGAGARHRIRLFRCPPILIDQANMIHGFFHPATVISFYVPMWCEGCDESASVLVERQRYEDEGMAEVPCKSCREPLEIDEWEEHYFGFLR